MNNINDKNDAKTLFKIILIILQLSYLIVSIILFCSFILKINSIDSYVSTSYFWHNIFYDLLNDSSQVISTVCVLVIFLLSIIYLFLSILKKFPPFMTSYVCIASSIISFIVNYFSSMLIERNTFWEFQIIILIPLISIILSNVFLTDDFFDYFKGKYFAKDSDKAQKYVDTLDDSFGKLSKIKSKQDIQTRKLNLAIDNIVANEEVKMTGEEAIEMAARKAIPNMNPSQKLNITKEEANRFDLPIITNNVIKPEEQIMPKVKEPSLTDNEIILADNPILQEDNNIISEESTSTENDTINSDAPVLPQDDNIISEESISTENDNINSDAQVLPDDKNIIADETFPAENVITDTVEPGNIEVPDFKEHIKEESFIKPTVIESSANVKNQKSDYKLIEVKKITNNKILNIEGIEDTLIIEDNSRDKINVETNISKGRIIYTRPPTKSMYIERKESILEQQKRILEDSEKTIFEYQSDEPEELNN